MISPQITTLGKTLLDLTSLIFVSNAALLVKNYQNKQPATQLTMHGDNNLHQVTSGHHPGEVSNFKKTTQLQKKFREKLHILEGKNLMK